MLKCGEEGIYPQEFAGFQKDVRLRNCLSQFAIGRGKYDSVASTFLLNFITG